MIRYGGVSDLCRLELASLGARWLLASGVAVEEGRLLLTVRGVVERIDVRPDPFRRLVEGGDELVDEDFLQSLQRLHVDGVLESRKAG